MKYANEFVCAGHMLPILTNYKVIYHTLTYRGIILSMIIPIHITYSPSHLYISGDWWYASLLTMAVTILLGLSYYSAHQAVIKFTEYHIDMVSCVHRKCQTRAGVSGDVSSSSSSGSSRRTDRLVHFQQNAGLWLFVLIELCTASMIATS